MEEKLILLQLLRRMENQLLWRSNNISENFKSISKFIWDECVEVVHFWIKSNRLWVRIICLWGSSLSILEKKMML